MEIHLPPLFINYHNRRFRSALSHSNGKASGETLFHYQQADDLVMATYTGDRIRNGQFLARATA